MSARGSIRVDADGSRHISGEHPLAVVVEVEQTLLDIIRLLNMPRAGDLVLFSARDSRGRVVNFQIEMGSHGGFHLEEQSAFVMCAPDIDFDFSNVQSMRDLYPLFERYHDGEPPAVSNS